MNKMMLVPAAVVLSAAFVSCGLVPAQTVKNPVGLKDQKIEAILKTPTGAAKAGLSTLATASTGAVTGSASFADDPNLNLPLTPAKFVLDLDFSGASFTNCPATLPNTVAVELAGFVVKVSDAATQATVNFATSSVTLTKSGTTYSVSKPTPALSAAIDNVGNLIKVLKEGGTNTASVTGTINTDKAELVGCTVSMTFAEGQGTISF